MRVFLVSILIASSFFLFTGCAITRKAIDLDKETTIGWNGPIRIIENNGYVITRVVSSDPECVTIVYTNNTRERLTYGYPFDLEIWEDGEWKVIPGGIFILPAFHLASGRSVTITENLTSIFGDLEPGTYRIGKDFGQYKTGERPSWDIRVYTEFEITS